ncbi:MAG: glycosyltransferase family 61 protein, partial [Hyphomicrobium sp.]
PLRVADRSLTEDWVIRWHEGAPHRAASSMAPELAVYEAKKIEVFGGEQFLRHSSGEVEESELFALSFSVDRLRAEPALLRLELPIREIESSNPIVVYQGHGATVYGHVLIEMLPRIVLLRLVGYDLSSLNFLIRRDTPAWHRQMLHELFTIRQDQLIEFDVRSERVRITNAILPTLPRSENGIHPAAAPLFELMAFAANSEQLGRSETSFLVRRPTTANPASYSRSISNFEDVSAAVAAVTKCKIVEPQSLTFREQVSLFQSAGSVIGEYGSALHNIIFSRHRPLCVCIGHINLLQSAITALRGGEVLYLSCNIVERNLLVDCKKLRQLLERARDAGVF